jgi:hypothetical protein
MSETGISDLLDANPCFGAARTGAKRFWTGREDKILRAAYPEGGVPLALEKLPGRSAKAIYQRSATIGVRRAGPKGAVPRQRWQASEAIDRLIARFYPAATNKGDVTKLAKNCGRPTWWVRKRAVRLGLAIPRFRELPWSEAEKAIVAEQAGHASDAAIVRQLKRAGFMRSEVAVSVMAKRLGASRIDPDRYSATGLGNVLGVDAKTVTRWIDKGWLKAKPRGTARVAVQGGDEWEIRRTDIARFIVDNVAAVDFRKLDKVWLVDLLTNEGRRP